MASIYKRKDGLYVAQYADAESGRQKYLYARKNKDVRAKLSAALERQAEGLREGSDGLTLGGFLSDWLAATESTVTESSFKLRRLYATKHISPALGHVKLSKLDALTVQTFYQQKHAAGMKPRVNRNTPRIDAGRRTGSIDGREIRMPGLPTAVEPLQSIPMSRPTAIYTPRSYPEFLHPWAGFRSLGKRRHARAFMVSYHPLANERFRALPEAPAGTNRHPAFPLPMRNEGHPRRYNFAALRRIRTVKPYRPRDVRLPCMTDVPDWFCR